MSVDTNSEAGRARACFGFLYKLLWTTTCLLLSFLSRRSVAGHTLRVAQLKILPFSLADVHIELPDSPHTISAATDVRFALFTVHWSLPSSTAPAFLTLHLHRALLTSTLSTVSTALLTVRVRAFPAHWRVSAGPPIHATLNDFRLRVLNSNATPHHVQRLRDALVGTILFGEVLRLHAFTTAVQFAPPPDAGADADDLSVTARAETLHMHDGKGRVYAFDDVLAGLRRSWGAGAGNRGTYEMEAHGGRWLRLPPFVLPPHPTRAQNLLAWLVAPAVLVHALVADPLRLVDLEVPAAYIRFDAFRMRDAALVRRGFEVLARTVVGFQSFPKDRCLGPGP